MTQRTPAPWFAGLRPGTVLYSPPVTLADSSVIHTTNEKGVLYDPQGSLFSYAGKGAPVYPQSGPQLSPTIIRSHKAARDRSRKP